MRGVPWVCCWPADLCCVLCSFVSYKFSSERFFYIHLWFLLLAIHPRTAQYPTVCLNIYIGLHCCYRSLISKFFPGQITSFCGIVIHPRFSVHFNDMLDSCMTDAIYTSTVGYSTDPPACSLSSGWLQFIFYWSTVNTAIYTGIHAGCNGTAVKGISETVDCITDSSAAAAHWGCLTGRRWPQYN